MHRSLIITALATLPLLAHAAGAPAAAHPAPSAHDIAIAGQAAATRMEACGNLSGALLASLARDDYKAATAHFDAKLQTMLSARKLRSAWTTLRARLGKLESQGTPRSFMYQDMPVISTPMHFAKGDLNAQVACNRQGLIAGFQVRPSAPGS